MVDAQILMIAGAVFAALAIGAFAKGATGLGLPFLAMPLLSQFFGVEHAVAIMVLPGVYSNGWLVWVHRRHAGALRNMRGFLIIGVIGGIAGTWFLSAADSSILMLCLAAALGGYLIFHFFNPHFRLSPALNRILAPPIGFAGGAVQGISGVSAPIIAPYVHALDLSKNEYVLGVAAAFTAFGIAQIISLFYFGVLTPARLAQGAFALIPVLLFLNLGIRFADRIDKKTFENIVIFIFILLEIKLIYDGLSGLLQG